MTNQVIYKRGDTAPPLSTTLKRADGSALDLTDADAVLLVLSVLGDPDVVFELAADIDATPTSGRVSRTWDEGDLDVEGYYLIEWQVTWSDASVETFPGETYQGLKVKPDLNPPPES